MLAFISCWICGWRASKEGLPLSLGARLLHLRQQTLIGPAHANNGPDGSGPAEWRKRLKLISERTSERLKFMAFPCLCAIVYAPTARPQCS